jgi:hypothetical protein
MTRSGEPCPNSALADRPFCWTHDPLRAVERHDARRRGGLNSHAAARDDPGAEPPRLRSVADVQAIVERELHATLSLSRSVQRSRTVAYLASVALKLIELGELEARVAAIETRLMDGRPPLRRVE